MSRENVLPSTSKSQLSKPKKTRVTNYAPRNSAMLRRRTQSETEMSADDVDTFGRVEREIRQFLDAVPAVPKLPKMPDIGKYVKKGKTVNRNTTASDRNSIINNYM